MATTATPNQPRVRPRGPASDLGDATGEHEYDLLIAALLGAAVGAGAALLLRRGPSGSRPLVMGVRGVARGARAGYGGARRVMRGRESLLDRLDVGAMKERVEDYLGHAREAIDDAVEHELRNLRRAIRRQRKRVGL